MTETIAKMKELFAVFGLQVLAGILIFLIGRWVARLVSKIVRKLLTKNHVDEMLVAFLCHVTYGLILTFVLIAAIGQLGVQTTSFIAVLGAAGLAIGLSLQGSLANFAAGVLLILFRPFKIGDFIDAGGATGVVEEIHIFTTKLKTPDNKAVIVPNAKLTADNITNYSAKDTRRVDLVFGVSYADDIDKVKEILTDVLNKDERILQDPPPKIALMDLADSSVNFVCRPWVKTEDYWDVYFSTNETVKKRFDAEGICIPFPQRDVHLYQR